MSSGKTPAWEVRPKQRGGFSGISQRMTLCMLSKTKPVVDDLQSTYYEIMMTINGYLLNLEIDLILQVFADTGQEVIECVVQWAWGFPPRSKWKVFLPAVVPQPLSRQNLLMLKLMWQFVLNRVWQIVRCMFMSRSSNREAAVLKDVITTGKR